jgi:hypothetical protein
MQQQSGKVNVQPNKGISVKRYMFSFIGQRKYVSFAKKFSFLSQF